MSPQKIEGIVGRAVIGNHNFGFVIHRVLDPPCAAKQQAETAPIICARSSSI